jgi:DNA recombination protein RmuC
MTGHFSKVGASLGKAVESYNKAVGSFEARVLVTARKFGEQGAVAPDADIDAPDPIETLVRGLQAPELEPQQRLGFPRSA